MQCRVSDRENDNARKDTSRKYIKEKATKKDQPKRQFADWYCRRCVGVVFGRCSDDFLTAII